ncbi:galactitol-1-phosphate 5-dehydrogenase [Yinghuangia aomiensis]|uniref:Galactitol-1-phosphate 5-dehydrogenase n=1 Tax=Yinghuangia aomiensis TaxID=676205 RepID=A0ABP9I7T0_9ACTN
MRALVLTDFGRLEVQDRIASEPGPGEVLIEIVATGICGSDIHGFTGANGRRTPGQIMGHEGVGHVASLGRGVTGLAVGTPVTFNPVVIPDEDVEEFGGREQHSPRKFVIGVRADYVSSFAQLMVAPARNVIALPGDMPIEYGALVEPLAVAVHAARRVDAASAHRALVVGGGPIGQSVVLALAMDGIHDVVVSETDPARRALVERLGARTIDPTIAPVPDQVRRLYGSLADVTLDAAGASSSVADALAATRPGGKVCLVGMASPRLELDAFSLTTEERSLVGSFAYSSDSFRAAASWMGAAPAVAAQLISRQVPLDDAPTVFAGLAARDGTPGKVLVRLDH